MVLIRNESPETIVCQTIKTNEHKNKQAHDAGKNTIALQAGRGSINIIVVKENTAHILDSLMTEWSGG